MAVHKKYNRSALGRGLEDIEGGMGLDALIDTTPARTQGTSTINEIPLDQIEANPNQPRREFDEEALEELAAYARLASFSPSHSDKSTTTDFKS